MQIRRSRNQQRELGAIGSAARPLYFHWARACIALAAMALEIDMALTGQQPQAGQMQPSRPREPIILPIANPVPDANDQMEMRDRQAKQKDYTAANTERRRQVAEDSASLLRLATNLKNELNKDGEGKLTADDVRRIDEIELLAHDLKEKMKLIAGVN